MERWERLVKVRSRDILSTLPVNLSKEGINREHPRLPDSAVVIQHRTSRFRSSGDPFTFREAPPSDTGTLRTLYVPLYKRRVRFKRMAVYCDRFSPFQPYWGCHFLMERSMTQ